MILKKTVLFLFVIISIQFSNAQLLWQISGKGLKHPSYLFGTHHLVPIQFLDSVPGLYKAFNQCDAVVAEMALNNIDATDKMQQAAMMPGNTKMRDLLNDSDYTRVDAELRKVLKLGLKELAMMKPTLIVSLYEAELYKTHCKLNDNNSQSDSYFQLVAEQKGKKIVGLETIDEQIKILFGNSTLEQQAELLVQTVMRKDSTLSDMILIDKLYKSGKLDMLLLKSKSPKTMGINSQLHSCPIVDRNTAWLKKLPVLLKNSSCFIAVDALHLPGSMGLIKQLEKAGYKVKAITNEDFR